MAGMGEVATVEEIAGSGRGSAAASCGDHRGSEVDQHSPFIAGVGFHAPVELLEMRLIQHRQNTMLQLAGAFAGDDLHDLDLLLNRTKDHGTHSSVDVPVTPEDPM